MTQVGSTGEPIVTIAIPTLNRVAFLRLAIESALAQTYPFIQVVVSNNACTDATADYLTTLNDPRLCLLRQEVKLSMVDNWNSCLEVAAGDYFILLSDDDLLEPTAVEEMLACYRKSEQEGPAAGIVYSRANIIDSEGKLIRTTTSSPLAESAENFILGFFRVKRRVMLCSILFRTTDVRPGFPKDFTLANDAALWMGLAIQYGAVAFVNKALSCYRFAENLTYSMSTDFWISENSRLMRLVKAKFAERGTMHPNLEKQLDEALSRYNLQCVSTGIRVKFQHDKLGGYRAYFSNIGRFTSAYGVALFARSMVTILLPDKIKPMLRKIFR